MYSNSLVFLIIILGMIYSIRTRKLTVIAALVGGIIGTLVYLGTGITGFSLMAVFFIIGSAVTKWRRDVKSRYLGEERLERTAGQVIANAGVAGLLAGLSLIFPAHCALFTLMTAGSFSSATADTVSSELGTVYGRKFFNILTLKPDRRGENGVISLEGTLLGLVGSVLITLVHISFEGWTIEALGIILAGTIGNLADSMLGAGLERKGWIKNNTVNFANTLLSALALFLFTSL